MYMKFKEIPENQGVYHWGTQDLTFYIIIKGLVNIYIPNRFYGMGLAYMMKRRQYLALQEWKTDVWDPKVEMIKE